MYIYIYGSDQVSAMHPSPPHPPNYFRVKGVVGGGGGGGGGRGGGGGAKKKLRKRNV